MGATIDSASYVAGVILGMSRSRHHSDPATVASSPRAPESAPDMSPGPRFFDGPVFAFGMAHSCADVFVGMLGHTGEYTHDHDGVYQQARQAKGHRFACTVHQPEDPSDRARAQGG